jgi:hypothetical protein
VAHQEASLRAILYALLANLGIALAKTSFSNSSALGALREINRLRGRRPFRVWFRGTRTVEEAVERINALERRLKAEAPEIGWCFVEPDCRK